MNMILIITIGLSSAAIISLYIAYRLLSCKHDWELKIERDVTDLTEFGTNSYTVYTYYCSKCGTWKKIKSS